MSNNETNNNNEEYTMEEGLIESGLDPQSAAGLALGLIVPNPL